MADLAFGIIGILATAEDLIEKVIDRCKDYREAKETTAEILLQIDAVKLHLSIFEAYLRTFEGSKLQSVDSGGVLIRAVQKLNGLLVDLHTSLPPNDPAVIHKVLWAAWKKKSAEGIARRLSGWAKEAHDIMVAWNILATVARKRDHLYERLFNDKSCLSSTAAAWNLSERIDSESISIPNIPSISDSIRGIVMNALDRLHHGRGIIHFETPPEGFSRQKKYYIEMHLSSRSAAKLAFVFNDPLLLSLHLLPCKGIMVNQHTALDSYSTGSGHGSAVVFYELPTHMLNKTPFNGVQVYGLPTLANALRNNVYVSLDDRYRLAVEIVTAVMEIHSAGWVHKSIGSSNIIVEVTAGQPGFPRDAATVGPAFLVGFDWSRAFDEPTFSSGSAIRNLRYVHPERRTVFDRQSRPDPKWKFNVRHDMYAIGAVLVELGFWKDLDLLFTELKRERRDVEGGIDTKSHAEHNDAFDEADHKQLLRIAGRLGPVMGTKYTRAVLACLQTSTDLSKDENDEATRREFYEQVLRPLREIYHAFQVIINKFRANKMILIPPCRTRRMISKTPLMLVVIQ